MKDQLDKVVYLDTELYLVKKNSPLQNAAMVFLHSVWGTLRANGEYPPIFPGPQPISIEREHFDRLQQHAYVVCEKTDGIRHVCMCFMFGDKKMCVIVNRALDVYLLPMNMPRKSYLGGGTIIDGELVKNTVDQKLYFMAYDGMIINGVDVRSVNLVGRLTETENNFVKHILKLSKDPLIIKLKTFYKLSDFENFFKTSFTVLPYKTDGFVFTPVDDPIRIGTHDTMFKWKPRDKNTIDFQVKNRTPEKMGLYIQEKGTLFFKSELSVRDYPDLYEDDIVECQYMIDDFPMWWKPVGIRRDKHHPNNRFTYFRTLKNISDDIQVSEFFDLEYSAK
jgi:hypothetical protein